MCSSDVFLGFLAVIFPPLPVWVKRGICSADSIINITLCVLGFVPGLLHAWYIIAKFPDEAYDYRSVPQDSEGGRVTYVYVQSDGRQVQQPPRPQAQPQYKQQQQQQQHPSQPKQPHQQQHGGMNYGATNGNNSAEAGGSSQAGGRAPPTYAEAVQGDHKIQTRD